WVANSLSPQEIRDRMLDKNSTFRTEMIQYLEGVHQGEFIDQTKEEVNNEVSYAASHPTYKDPTETLPDPPPYPCDHPFAESCNVCVSSKSWWSKFKDTVNDLLLKSNIHRECDDRCLVKGVCKARFPRPLINETHVDENTGYIEMQKKESMINTFTPALTYLLRSNSDVTSLLSGTALKAVVAYVTDYITKTPLKTYTIFQTIRDVFDRQSSILGGDLRDQEKARKLLTQIVNSLTVKMEIGAPMASAYLLGNPDHYTSHKFKTVFWKSYVGEVLQCWDEPSGVDSPDLKSVAKSKVMVRKTKDGYTPYSVVMDYTHRSREYEDINLYDWIRLSRKKTIPKTTDKDKEIPDNTDDDASLSGSDEDPTIDNREAEGKKNKKTDPYELTFINDHPQRNKHYIMLVKEGFGVVPNFIGGSLPRRDEGDREFYCTTMMTLFHPWRTGLDLKSKDQTWDDVFHAHNFTARQEQLMSYFNIQYECYDARDDYARQKKGKNKAIPGLPNISGDELDERHNLNDDHSYSGLHDDPQVHNAAEFEKVGNSTIKRIHQMEEMEKILNGAGWLEKCPEQITIDTPSGSNSIEYKSKQQWTELIQNKKTSILEEKEKHRQSKDSNDNAQNKIKTKWNEVKIVDQSYLLKEYFKSRPNVAKLQSRVVKEFSLRPDQARAFHIIANHASE
ncbi:hypothetical protein GLOTRDRAFT_25513, partial [Gloeophyllum trabeum ATCC 11539]